MKQLLNHALFLISICAGLSAGALYAPGNPILGKKDLKQIVNRYCDTLSKAGQYALKGEAILSALNAGHGLCRNLEQPCTLQNLYHAVTVAKDQHLQSDPPGYGSALSAITGEANTSLSINPATDFTPENVANLSWWRFYYPGIVRQYIENNPLDLSAQAQKKSESEKSEIRMNMVRGLTRILGQLLYEEQFGPDNLTSNYVIQKLQKNNTKTNRRRENAKQGHQPTTLVKRCKNCITWCFNTANAIAPAGQPAQVTRHKRKWEESEGEEEPKIVMAGALPNTANRIAPAQQPAQVAKQKKQRTEPTDAEKPMVEALLALSELPQQTTYTGQNDPIEWNPHSGKLTI